MIWLLLLPTCNKKEREREKPEKEIFPFASPLT